MRMKETLSLADKDKLLADGGEPAACEPEALQSAKVGTDKEVQLLTQVLSFMTKVDSNLCSVNEVFKRWTDDHEMAATAMPPKRRKTSQRPDKMSDSEATDDEQSDSEASNMVPKPSTGDLPNAQKANSSAATADELLNEIAQDFESDKKTDPKVAQKLADIVNKRWTSKLEETKPKD